MTNLQPKAPGGTYVRLTFLPGGAKRRRTIWAVKLYAADHATLQKYRVVQKDGGAPENVLEIVMTKRDGSDSVERPAAMNYTYGELEVLK